MNKIFKLLCERQLDPKNWDKNVVSLKGGFFHSYNVIQYRAKLVGAQPIYFKALNQTREVIGLAAGVISTSKIWPFSTFCKLVSFPSLPITIMQQEQECLFLKKIEFFLIKKGVFKIEFDSYHSPSSDKILRKLEYEVIERNEYDFDLSLDLNDLFNSFNATKRKQYKKSEKNGVVTKDMSSLEGINLVEKLRGQSMKRRGLSSFDDLEKKKLSNEFLFNTGCLRVLVSFIGDDPVGACLFGVFNNKAYALRSGSSEIGNKNYSPINLYWTAIKWFKQEGYINLNLGGARSYEKGISTFKKMMGTIETHQPAGSKIISSTGNVLDQLREKIKKTVNPKEK